MGKEGGVGEGDQFPDVAALAGVLGVVHELEVGCGVKVVCNLAEAFFVWGRWSVWPSD